MEWIYLDNNATTRPAPGVVAAVAEMEETLWANPSSVHRFGQAVRQRVELARASVAALIGCRDRGIGFYFRGHRGQQSGFTRHIGPDAGIE